jgi:hypothetical protein
MPSPGFRQRVSKMWQGKALAAIAFVLAVLALAPAEPSRAAEQGGSGYRGRSHGGAGWNGAAAPGTFAAPHYYGYGYPPVSAIPSFPYGNPYTQRSSGCCHGRN